MATSIESRLKAAVKNENIKDVWVMLQNEPTILNRNLGRGARALHMAADKGSKRMVKFLLAQGADPCVLDDGNHTPLHRALLYGTEDVAKVLVKLKRNTDCQSRRGFTPLHLAAERGFLRIVRKLLALGSNVLARNIYGRTPLHLALLFGGAEVAEVLIDSGGGNDVQDQEGRTPLHVAARRGYVEIARKLVIAGADTRCKCIHGRTPLHCALTSGGEDVSKLLVDFDSGNDIQDVNGYTPLHIAANEGVEYVVWKLLLSNVRPHVRSDGGLYPLSFAVKRGWIDIVNTILLTCASKDVEIVWEDLDIRVERAWYCSRLLTKFRAEIQRMKKAQLPGTSVSYYDLLRRPVTKMALYLENENVRHSLCFQNRSHEFPSYALRLLSNLKEASKRRRLTKQCLECFSVLSRILPALSRVAIDVLLLYLNEEDMRTFGEAFTPIFLNT